MKTLHLKEIEKRVEQQELVESLKNQKGKSAWARLYAAYGKHTSFVRQDPKQ